MMSDNPVRAVLKVTYSCNSMCLFCRAADYRGSVPDEPAETILKKALAAKNAGASMILFSGGEPTLRRDLFLLARGVRALGMDFGLITNCGMLGNPDYLGRMLSLGLKYVHTSLHGASAETHRSITGADTFNAVLRSLAALSGQGVELHVNTVLNRRNVRELAAIGDLVAPFAPITHKLCLMEPRGLFQDNEADLAIQPELAGRAGCDEVARTAKRYPESGFKTVVEGFPLCQIRTALDSVSNLLEHNIVFMSEGFEDGIYKSDHGDRQFTDICDSCSKRNECPGVYPGYVERYGVVGLRAFR
ncbi:MAG TPA: radical SAM protein [Myxococcota bacterium]|nr:radical SAM protein [Myxococcota bacterium]HNZ02728.1 radical SAM protein [Myxococcota bacterium]HOD06911.1 radical SAM protein [Myxococcota bacterium]HPB50188.1 radical SAM protein [Myxococcota bacterium]HQP95030.1 radical SAM protein [Myxococcota bacterium]